MTRIHTLAVASIAAAAFSWQAFAQHAGGHPKPDMPKMDHMKMDHSKMGHGKAASPAGGHTGHVAAAGDSPSTAAFKAANDKMHAGMAIPFTGDADVDFVKGMIPHHEGAVEMARIVLLYGKDPELKKLARDIIAAQDKEIAFMRRWLTKKGKS